MRSVNTLRRGIFYAAVATFAGLFILHSYEAADALSLVVNDAANAGDGTCDATCTLRDAMDDADANAGADTITFDAGVFPPGTPATITLSSTLPTLTTGSDTIDGTGAGVIVQGAEARTFACIRIDSSGNAIQQLQFTDCLTGVWLAVAASDNNTIGPGNSFSDSNHGVELSSGASGNTVRGNKIGTNPAGTAIPAEGANNRGIYIAGPNNIVGGSLPADSNVISGNTDAGIRIEGAGATGNEVRGNYIGTDITGTVDLTTTATAGIVIGLSASSNTIGGSTAADRNIISGNNDSGVNIFGSGTNGNTVAANYIGLNAGGIAAIANGNGVVISSGAQGNTVGGDAAGERNVISGNSTDGVQIQSSTSTGNAIIGNYIGTDAVGTADVGNTRYGIMLNDAPTNNVGGVLAGEGNVISGNNSIGVLISGDGADGNLVRANYIGTNAAGTAALANSMGGVTISGSADNNDIGGTSASARNVIAGNSNNGVNVSGSGTTGNLVRANYIGTNAAGTGGIANTQNGVEIAWGTTNNTIGGATVGEGNVISGNIASGVLVQSSGTTGNSVKGNYIGTDAGGTADLGNTSYGVLIQASASSNTVGGTASSDRNVISGNNSDGVRINSAATTGNVVAGNYIGTNASGTAALANAGAGVSISSANGNTVGGTAAGAGNVISGNSAGNSGIGVNITGASATGNVVQGNLIGTNAAGTAAIPNSAKGVVLNGADNNTIGGTVAGARNVMSGNTAAGITIVNGGNGNVVQGNFVGTDVSGTADLGNGGVGIEISTTDSGNTIGGTTAGAGNVVSGNAGSGMSVQSMGNVIQGNFIGTQADGASPLGNGAAGISIFAAGSNTTGGTIAGAGNVIAFNTGIGVAVEGAAATGNMIRGNSIHANGSLGIDNSSGGNANLAPPVITSINTDTSIVSGTTCSGCAVEVFSDGVDEGRVFHGVAVTTVTDWTFTGAFGGPQLTVTATDGSGNTSEFSSPVPLVVLGAGSGETAPGTGGGTFGTAADLGVNDSGQAVFRNTVNDGTATEGIFAFFSASAVEAVAVQGQNTPIGGTYETFGPPVNNNAGTVTARATVSGGTEGLFAFFSAAPDELLAAEGGSAPGGGTFSTFSNPSINNVNQVAARATVSGPSEGLYAFFSASPTPDQQLAIQGGSAPGGGTFSSFGDPSINDLGWVAARATVSGPSEGLYAFFSASPTQLLAKQGDPVPGTTGTFNTFGNPSINNSGTTGRVAARATIAGGVGTEGVFAFFSASPTQKLALQGETAPGTGGATFVSFGDPVINDLGQVVVKATLTGGPVGAPTEGIFAFFSAAPSQGIVLEGDVAAEGGTYLDFLFIAYNDVAQIVFVANVSGGPSAQGVFFASLDLDRDGIVDFQDNCPTVFNTDQHNNEGDARGNACDPDDDNDTICDPGQSDPACTGSDNCVFVANTSQTDANSNGIGDACDTADTDGDNFSDRLEARVGTSAALACGANAWPPDFNSDSAVTGADLSAIAADIGKAVPPAPQRKDIAPDLPDGAITGADLSAVAAVIGTNCN